MQDVTFLIFNICTIFLFFFTLCNEVLDLMMIDYYTITFRNFVVPTCSVW